MRFPETKIKQPLYLHDQVYYEMEDVLKYADQKTVSYRLSLNLFHKNILKSDLHLYYSIIKKLIALTFQIKD